MQVVPAAGLPRRPPRGVPAQYSLPIDFVFVRVPQTLSLHISSDLRFSSKFDLDHRRQDFLSDHNAIEVSFTIDTLTGPVTATDIG